MIFVDLAVLGSSSMPHWRRWTNARLVQLLRRGGFKKFSRCGGRNSSVIKLSLPSFSRGECPSPWFSRDGVKSPLYTSLWFSNSPPPPSLPQLPNCIYCGAVLVFSSFVCLKHLAIQTPSEIKLKNYLLVLNMMLIFMLEII